MGPRSLGPHGQWRMHSYRLSMCIHPRASTHHRREELRVSDLLLLVDAFQRFLGDRRKGALLVCTVHTFRAVQLVTSWIASITNGCCLLQIHRNRRDISHRLQFFPESQEGGRSDHSTGGVGQAPELSTPPCWHRCSRGRHMHPPAASQRDACGDTVAAAADAPPQDPAEAVSCTVQPARVVGGPLLQLAALMAPEPAAHAQRI